MCRENPGHDAGRAPGTEKSLHFGVCVIHGPQQKECSVVFMTLPGSIL